MPSSAASAWASPACRCSRWTGSGERSRKLNAPARCKGERTWSKGLQLANKRGTASGREEATAAKRLTLPEARRHSFELSGEDYEIAASCCPAFAGFDALHRVDPARLRVLVVELGADLEQIGHRL